MTQLIGAFHRGLDLILPPTTLDGGRPAQGSGLSPAAFSRITFLEAPVCDGCGAPQEYDAGEAVRCAACTGRKRAFDRVRAAVTYDDASRDLILQFKHADRLDLVRLFSGWIGRAAVDLLAEAQVVTPVPLHPARLLAPSLHVKQWHG